MTANEYRSALTVLGLSQQAAGRWLMVSPKTAQNYANKGPSGPAARAVTMAVALISLKRSGCGVGFMVESDNGPWISRSDLIAAIGLQSPPTKAEDR